MLRHIGFIMDGNGRWATSRGLRRSEGYKSGLEALVRVLVRCSERGIEAVTVFAYSTENVLRPEEESRAIFDIVKKFNANYAGDFRIRYIGDIDSLDEELVNSIDDVERRTEANDGMKLTIALMYGGRADILHAAKLCYDKGEFTDEAFENNLSTSFLPPLDLIVRTGGEKRLSNFLLYEAAYAELIFLDKMWGDMTAEDVDAIIAEFEGRNRKFGS